MYIYQSHLHRVHCNLLCNVWVWVGGFWSSFAKNLEQRPAQNKLEEEVGL